MHWLKKMMWKVQMRMNQHQGNKIHVGVRIIKDFKVEKGWKITGVEKGWPGSKEPTTTAFSRGLWSLSHTTFESSSSLGKPLRCVGSRRAH